MACNDSRSSDHPSIHHPLPPSLPNPIHKGRDSPLVFWHLQRIKLEGLCRNTPDPPGNALCKAATHRPNAIAWLSLQFMYSGLESDDGGRLGTTCLMRGNFLLQGAYFARRIQKLQGSHDLDDVPQSVILGEQVVSDLKLFARPARG